MTEHEAARKAREADAAYTEAQQRFTRASVRLERARAGDGDLLTAEAHYSATLREQVKAGQRFDYYSAVLRAARGLPLDAYDQTFLSRGLPR